MSRRPWPPPIDVAAELVASEHAVQLLSRSGETITQSSPARLDKQLGGCSGDGDQRRDEAAGQPAWLDPACRSRVLALTRLPRFEAGLI